LPSAFGLFVQDTADELQLHFLLRKDIARWVKVAILGQAGGCPTPTAPGRAPRGANRRPRAPSASFLAEVLTPHPPNG